MRYLPCAVLVVSLAACGGQPGDAALPSSADPGQPSGFEAPVCEVEGELCLAAPSDGFQIVSQGTHIEAGQDVEYCEVVELPGGADDVYHVTAFESQMTQGSHHLIVSAIEPDTDTAANADVGMRMPCSGPDVFGGELLPVTGSQQAYNSEVFPDGVGQIYQGGQKIVFDYHYFNTSAAPIEARAAVNFHTVDASQVTRLGHGFGFYNLGIDIPPGASKGFDAECMFSQDIVVHKLTRHTHRWGTDFSVWFAGGDRDGEHIFTSPDYETVAFPFDEPVLMPAGTGFRFRCDYQNTEDHTLKFGLRASDEMCILFGGWFVPNEGDAVSEQGCYRL
jgi:hypothetical protein